MITHYQKCISGPLLNPIDTHVEGPGVQYKKLSDKRAGETLATIRARAEAACKR